MKTVVISFILVSFVLTQFVSQAVVVGSELDRISTDSDNCGTLFGVAFDGTNLYSNCVFGHRIFKRLAAAPHTPLGSVPVNVPINAIAWDFKRNQIWACSGTSDAANAIYLIDPNTGAATFKFNSIEPCVDGLGYDPFDDTLWVSADRSDRIYHYRASDFVLIASFGGLAAKLGGTGNSGIAVGPTLLTLASGSGGTMIQIPKDISTPTPIPYSGFFIEDMECDGLTFANTGFDAVWTTNWQVNNLVAIAVQKGSCGNPFQSITPTCSAAVQTSCTQQGLPCCHNSFSGLDQCYTSSHSCTAFNGQTYLCPADSPNICQLPSGNQCYGGNYVCASNNGVNALCPTAQPLLCGTNSCYSSAQYNCVGGVLVPK